MLISRIVIYIIKYLKRGKLTVQPLGRGIAWLDTGSHNSLLEASQFVETVQKRQGLYISCIEEIAYNKGFIDEVQLLNLTQPLLKTEYGKYLKNIVKNRINNDIKTDIDNFDINII